LTSNETDNILLLTTSALLLILLAVLFAPAQPLEAPAHPIILLPMQPPKTENYQTMTNQQPLSAFLNELNVPNMPYPPYDYAEYTEVVTHDGNPSLHVLEDSGWASGEIDGAWINVSPGYHIVLGGWVKTGAFEPTDPQAGGGFGFDFYGHSNIGYGILGTSPTDQIGHPTGAEKNYGNPTDYGYSINGEAGLTQVSGKIVKVPFNTDWTLVEWDFIVPYTYYTYVYTTGPTLSECEPVHIDSLVMWTWVNDNGEVWFSDPYMYITTGLPVAVSSALMTLMRKR
jgi:hypothetical protein